MIAQAFRGPHNLYRRYQAFFESSLTALGLAAIVSLALYYLPVYPLSGYWLWEWPLLSWVFAGP